MPSMHHWKFVGTAIHQRRGEWLISRVHVVLGHAMEALRHAERCFELTNAHKDLRQDFDIAYAFEGLASAVILPNRLAIFMGDFEGGNWYGLR